MLGQSANWGAYDATTASVTPHVDAEEAPAYVQTPGPAGVVSDAGRSGTVSRVMDSLPADHEHVMLWLIVTGSCVGLLLLGHGLNGVRA